MLTEAELQREAAATGYRSEVLEKVIRLLELLDTLRMHPFLRPRIALKGGTALNLFIFDAPRLSVDIDLNYVGVADRETMLADRPKVERAIHAVCGRLGIQVKRVPSDHAGGKWRLSYTSVTGRSGTFELDLNFMLRTPLWSRTPTDSHSVGAFTATKIPMLDVHELAAGKLGALFSRSASRDLFDIRELLQRGKLERTKLRLGFVVYGGINRRDWREVSLDDVQTNPDEVDRQLLPVLRGNMAPVQKNLREWTEQLIEDCRDLLSIVFPFEEHEREFLNRLNDRGDIAAELLTDDARLQEVIRTHPALLWKAQNVKKHFGVTDS